MSQKTYLDYDPVASKMDAITVCTYVCPHCRAGIKIIVPDRNQLKSHAEEAAFFRSRLEAAYAEIHKLNQHIELLQQSR